MVSPDCQAEIDKNKELFDNYKRAEKDWEQTNKRLEYEEDELEHLRYWHGVLEEGKVKDELKEKIKKQYKLVLEIIKILYVDKWVAYKEAATNFFNAPGISEKCLKALLLCEGCIKEFKPEFLTLCNGCPRSYCDTCFDASIQAWEVRRNETSTA